MRNLLNASLGGQRYWLFLLLLLLLLVVYLPLLSAGFYSDDWTFLAWSRHGDGPLGFFVYDHSFTYMYRPVAMTSWWSVTQLAGLEAHWHYLFAILLHVGSVLLGVLWLRRQGVSWVLQMLALAALLAHPTSGATVAWLADRFDLMMSFGVMLGLFSLSYLEVRPQQASIGVLLALLIAIGSKETGLILVPIALSTLLICDLSIKRRVILAGSILLLTLIYFIARKLVLGSLGGITSGGGVIQAFLKGAWLWFGQLPQAFAGQGMPVWLGAGLLLVLLLGLLGFAFTASWRQRLLVLQLLFVVAGLALLQAPVTQIVLDQAEPFRSVVNYRFYYLAVMALVLLSAYLLHVLTVSNKLGWYQPAPVVLALPLIVAWVSLGFVGTKAWAGWTGAEARDRVLMAVKETLQAPELIAISQLSETCLVRLTGAADKHTDMHGYSDLMVKAHIRRDSPLVDCVFASEKEPWKAISLWQSEQDASYQNGLSQNRSDSYRSGRLALHTKLSKDAHHWAWKSYQYQNQKFIAE
ncbi:MAG: hypothetical protein MI750_15125 [Xanthomonadales bacterium]|nr:hypothetical protein [Xanthomonadales bacterium]